MQLEKLPSHLKRYFDQLSKVISYSSESWYYSTSHFFSKVGAYEAVIKFQNGSRVNVWLIFSQLCRYTFKVSFLFLFYIFSKLIYKIFGSKTKIARKETIYLDSYLLVKNALEGKGLVESYFPGLVEFLNVKNYNCIILPRLYGSHSLKEIYQLFRVFKNSKATIITEFQLLDYQDYFRLIIYLIVYPVKMLEFYFKIIQTHPDNGFLKYYFWLDMNGSNFYGAVRYLYAEKLAKIFREGDRIVQWFENQPYEKCLNRALNSSTKNIRIFGCQLFLYPQELFNAYIDPNELELHKPGKILVNGEFYLEKSGSGNAVGPSLRYKKLFETVVHRNLTTARLILLSYFDNANQSIIKLINSLNQSGVHLVKLHPSASESQLKDLINFDYSLALEDIYSLFNNVSIVVGAASGSLIEAIACGIPAIIVSENGGTEYNYLPDFCKGVLWDVAFDKNSFLIVEEVLASKVRTNDPLRLNMIQRVRSELFTEPTEERILEAFELS